MSSLVEGFNTVQRSKPVSVPRGFDSPGTVDYTAGTSTLVTSEAVTSEDYRKLVEEHTGLPVPDGLDVILDKASLQSDADGHKARWLKFKFVPRALSAESFSSSIAALQEEIASVGAHRKGCYNNAGVILNVADLQIGKTGSGGGTPETIAAFHNALAQAIVYIKETKPSVIVLAELGDGIENFQNVASQAQTNDRSLIEQINLHTELMTYAAVELSKLAPKLIVVGVPSNHAEVRENGKPVGGPANDYGLLSLSNVKRAMSLNMEAFGHVEFAWPSEHEVSLTIDVAGVPVGFTHGHHSRGASNGVEKWITGQLAGNQPLQAAHIIITAHFHELKCGQLPGDRWWFQAPTCDRGSDWFRHSSGKGDSQNGMLLLQVADGTWRDMKMLRTA